MTTTMIPDAEWLIRLSAWFSPAYPVGAFSYSHGLEWAVETGAVRTRHDLLDYISTALERGSGWADLVFAAASWRAATDGNEAALDGVAELAEAMRGSTELALESAQQGRSFTTITQAAWAGTPLDALALRRGGQIAYPVAIGTAAAGTIPLPALLIAYAQAFAANLVSAGVRLVPLGQTDGQRTQADLTPVIAHAAQLAESCRLDDIGTSAPMIDLYSIRHETQYTRLFRS